MRFAGVDLNTAVEATVNPGDCSERPRRRCDGVAADPVVFDLTETGLRVRPRSPTVNRV